MIAGFYAFFFDNLKHFEFYAISFKNFLRIKTKAKTEFHSKCFKKGVQWKMYQKSILTMEPK